MKNKTIIGLLFLALVFQTENLIAQSNEWKVEKCKDSKFSIKSSLSTTTNEIGQQVQLIDYVATTTANLNLKSCISLMKEASKNKTFFDDKENEMMKGINHYGWLTYYYLIGPWPKTKGNCGPRMLFSEDTILNTIKFTLTTTINTLDKKGVNQSGFYNLTYELKDIGDGKVEISAIAKISPVVKAPKWLVSSFFSDGPAEILKNFIKAANSRA